MTAFSLIKSRRALQLRWWINRADFFNTVSCVHFGHFSERENSNLQLFASKIYQLDLRQHNLESHANGGLSYPSVTKQSPRQWQTVSVVCSGSSSAAWIESAKAALQCCTHCRVQSAKRNKDLWWRPLPTFHLRRRTALTNCRECHSSACPATVFVAGQDGGEIKR